jgi:hypothetical protein
MLLQKAKIIEERRGKTDHRTGNSLREIHPEKYRQATRIGQLGPKTTAVIGLSHSGSTRYWNWIWHRD